MRSKRALCRRILRSLLCSRNSTNLFLIRLCVLAAPTLYGLLSLGLGGTPIAWKLGLEGTETTLFCWLLLLAGLTLMGLAASLTGGLRLLGAVVSISGALGWVSVLTDPAFSGGVLVPMRPVHVAFAAAFCLSTVVWGAVLMVSRENR